MIVTNGISHYATCKETPSFSFYEDENLWSRRIYFVNQKDWRPRNYSVICINHFEKRFIKYGKKCYVKVGISLSEKICILVQWKPSKNDEKNFYCSLRAFFVLKTFKFFSWVFGHVEKKCLIRRKILKFMTSQAGLQIVTMHILPTISRRKDNRKMKFCQLSEFNRRNIFLQKSC